MKTILLIVCLAAIISASQDFLTLQLLDTFNALPKNQISVTDAPEGTYGYYKHFMEENIVVRLEFLPDMKLVFFMGGRGHENFTVNCTESYEMKENFIDIHSQVVSGCLHDAFYVRKEYLDLVVVGKDTIKMDIFNMTRNESVFTAELEHHQEEALFGTFIGNHVDKGQLWDRYALMFGDDDHKVDVFVEGKDRDREWSYFCKDVTYYFREESIHIPDQFVYGTCMWSFTQRYNMFWSLRMSDENIFLDLFYKDDEQFKVELSPTPHGDYDNLEKSNDDDDIRVRVRVESDWSLSVFMYFNKTGKEVYCPGQEYTMVDGYIDLYEQHDEGNCLHWHFSHSNITGLMLYREERGVLKMELGKSDQTKFETKLMHVESNIWGTYGGLYFVEHEEMFYFQFDFDYKHPNRTNFYQLERGKFDNSTYQCQDVEFHKIHHPHGKIELPSQFTSGTCLYNLTHPKEVLFNLIEHDTKLQFDIEHHDDTMIHTTLSPLPRENSTFAAFVPSKDHEDEFVVKMHFKQENMVDFELSIYGQENHTILCPDLKYGVIDGFIEMDQESPDSCLNENFHKKGVELIVFIMYQDVIFADFKEIETKVSKLHAKLLPEEHHHHELKARFGF